jgi:hypothetical protein
MSDKRKLLNRLGQNGTWSGPAVIQSSGADAVPPAKRRGLTHTATTTERGKPVASPRDPPVVRDSEPQGEPTGLRVQDEGASESRPVTGRIGIEPRGDIIPRASGQTSLGCERTGENSQPALGSNAEMSAGSQ